MEFLLKDIENALKSRLYFIALQSTLTLPDICGALESDSRDVGKRYKKWYDANMKGKSILKAEDCYAFRNGILHRAYAKNANLGYERVLFVHPDNSFILTVDNSILNNAVCIDLLAFCKNMIEAVRIWEIKMRDSNNANFIKNYPNLIQVHPEGISPYIVGIPVIG
jgi:hypothetical protein